MWWTNIIRRSMDMIMNFKLKIKIEMEAKIEIKMTCFSLKENKMIKLTYQIFHWMIRRVLNGFSLGRWIRIWKWIFCLEVWFTTMEMALLNQVKKCKR